MKGVKVLPGEHLVGVVTIAVCGDCGWSRVADLEGEAEAAGIVHRLLHRYSRRVGLLGRILESERA